MILRMRNSNQGVYTKVYNFMNYCYVFNRESIFISRKTILKKAHSLYNLLIQCINNKYDTTQTGSKTKARNISIHDCRPMNVYYVPCSPSYASIISTRNIQISYSSLWNVKSNSKTQTLEYVDEWINKKSNKSKT